MSNMNITVPTTPKLNMKSASFPTNMQMESGKTDHSRQSNLDYEHSGHTGFQQELSQEQIDNINSIPGLAKTGEVNAKLENYVKNTDIASPYKLGIVKGNPNNGVYIQGDGTLKLTDITEAIHITNKQTNQRLSPNNQDYAVMCSTHQDMADDYDVSTGIKHIENCRFRDDIPDVGNMPVSYNAVKNYIAKIIEDINTSLAEKAKDVDLSEAQEEITDLILNDIKQGQKITDLELKILKNERVV